MGNYISCALGGAPYKYSGVKVIFSCGDVRQYDRSVNAAELMLDESNHFVVNSRSLQIGRRFAALSADEDLEMGNVYVMIPMKRLNSVVTTADMAGLFMTTNSAIKSSTGGGSRILPEKGGSLKLLSESGESGDKNECSETNLPRLNLDDIEDVNVGEMKHRLSMCRSRKPLLETIIEEPFCTRFSSRPHRERDCRIWLLLRPTYNPFPGSVNDSGLKDRHTQLKAFSSRLEISGLKDRGGTQPQLRSFPRNAGLNDLIPS